MQNRDLRSKSREEKKKSGKEGGLKKWKELIVKRKKNEMEKGLDIVAT